MAKSKKTKSTPNPTTTRVLMKALKRNRSVETLEPSKSNSSPESVKKKAISSTLQKQLTSKKRKRVNEPEPPQCIETFTMQGLQLLKRGAVTMHRIVRQKILGIKHHVFFNDKGESYGKAGTHMQSYIGVLARTKTPIYYATWKKVPKERKNKIWECVKMAFDVPPSAEKMVLKSACQKWREFKSRLTTDYILPYCDQPEVLKYPPADYSFIEKAHWDMFVAARTSAEFLELHNNQTKIRELNLYPHRLSRKGYSNLEQELSAGDPTIEIDRSETWIKARKDKDGNFLNDEVREVAEKIEKMKKAVSEGEVIVEGVNDVLTKVLGNPEHRGRVRGQGVHVKQSTYFNLPRQKKKMTMDEKIREGVQKFMAEETSKIVQQRDAFWASEIEKLKASFSGKNVKCDGSPMIDSQQGSCSKGGDVINKELDGLGGVGGVKKKLDLVEHEVLVEEKNEEAVDVDVQIEGEKMKVEFTAKKVVPPVVGGMEWQLAVGSPKNVVAFATIEIDAEGCEQTLHGVPLVKENARVSITRVIQGDAKIPFPVKDEIQTVEEAFGTFVAWPRDLILDMNPSTGTAPLVISTPDPVIHNAKGGKKNVGKKWKNMKDCGLDYVVEMGADYPSDLKRLWIWAKDAMTGGRTTPFQLCPDAFGSTKKQVLLLSDVYALCSRGEISGSIICIYIHLLQENLKRNKMTSMIAFVDPGIIGANGCGSAEDRSRAIATRFKNAKKGQYFLLPYNHANHWVLSVVNPDAQIVYHLDPLKRRIASAEWIEVIDRAIKLYKEKAKRFLKNKIIWENLAGVPVQSGSVDCGLFMMLYMKEITEDKDFDFCVKWIRRTNLTYSEADINGVKNEWAKFFLKHYTC